MRGTGMVHDLEMWKRAFEADRGFDMRECPRCGQITYRIRNGNISWWVHLSPKDGILCPMDART